MSAESETQTPAELLARLVAFDTTSYRSNLGIIAFIEDYLRRHGVADHAPAGSEV